MTASIEAINPAQSASKKARFRKAAVVLGALFVGAVFGLTYWVYEGEGARVFMGVAGQLALYGLIPFAVVLAIAHGVVYGNHATAAAGNSSDGDSGFNNGPSMNVDGTPMMGSLDINGNPYGVTSTDSFGTMSFSDSSH